MTSTNPIPISQGLPTFQMSRQSQQNSQPLNVVCLISGGKDSLYSLLHCVQQGHRVVALGNLYPSSDISSGSKGGDGSEKDGAVDMNVDVSVTRILPGTNPRREFGAGDKVTRDELNTTQHIVPKSQDESQVQQEGEDVNSFMYQTVGHSAIPLYAEALGLPLYRRVITGKARDSRRDYHYQTRESSRTEVVSDRRDPNDDDVSTNSHQRQCGGDNNEKIDRQEEKEEEDETESLTHLLLAVMKYHPEINAVSAGAILSTYQRTRIESVALRLGLTPLAWLWMYPFLPPPGASPPSTHEMSDSNALDAEYQRDDSLTGLLDDMDSAGCRSLIIKIASGGIREDVLGMNVSASKTRKKLLEGIKKVVTMGTGMGDSLGGFGSYRKAQPQIMSSEMEKEIRASVLGEGGEYESLAVEGPRGVWKGKIVFVDDEVGNHQSRILTAEGGVNYLRLAAAKVELFEDEIGGDDNGQTSIGQRIEGYEKPLVRISGLLDPQFEEVQKRLVTMENQPENISAMAVSSQHLKSESGSNGQTRSWWPPSSSQANISIASHQITISNITSSSPANSASASSQLESITIQIHDLLKTISQTHHISPPLTTSNIISSLLLLLSITDFSAINPIYASLFPRNEPNPPSRVTIACSNFPPEIKVSLSLVLDLRPRDRRKALHIQSRSYWAPANIGPYSQAVSSRIDIRREVKDGVDDRSEDESVIEAVHLAGQIPLVPASMEPLEGTFEEQTVLALQHLCRVAQERTVDTWPWGVAFLAKETVPQINMTVGDQVRIASEVWKMACWRLKSDVDDASKGECEDDSESDSDSNGPDLWDLKYNRGSIPTLQQSIHVAKRSQKSKAVHNEIGNHIHILPNPLVYARPPDQIEIKHRLSDRQISSYETSIPPLIAAQVLSLPRQVSIEWWSLGLANLYKSSNTRTQLRQARLDLACGSGWCTYIAPENHDRDTRVDDEKVRGVTVCFASVYVSSQEWLDMNGQFARGSDRLSTEGGEDNTIPKNSNTQCLAHELEVAINVMINKSLGLSHESHSSSKISTEPRRMIRLVHGTTFFDSDVCDLNDLRQFLNHPETGHEASETINESATRKKTGEIFRFQLEDTAVIPCSAVFVTTFDKSSMAGHKLSGSTDPTKTPAEQHVPERTAFVMTLRIDVDL